MSRVGTTMPTLVTALAARTQLGQIMHRAKHRHERFLVDRRGELQVVILGVQDFLRNIAPEYPVQAAMRKHALSAGKQKISMREIDREIRATRKERKLKRA